jgi:hypothetical protein
MRSWREVVEEFRRRHPGQKMTRRVAERICGQAIEKLARALNPARELDYS